MYGPVQFRLPFFVRPRSPGFAVTCPGFPLVHGFGATEHEAVERAKDDAISYFRALVSSDEPLPDGPLYLRGPNAKLESAIREILNAAYPGEKCSVRIEEVWLDALQ